MSTLSGTPAARWAIALTEIPSVTGIAHEAGFAGRLVDLLRDSPLFADRPNDVWTLPVPGGQHERACVCALLRGRGARTVMLTGHFDTMGIDDYGDLMLWCMEVRGRSAGLVP
jgi:arginine utilization protein RocB